MTAPWDGREISWRIDGETHTARYNPAEIRVMQIARERGETTADLEAVHMLKTILDATIIDTEATQRGAA